MEKKKKIVTVCSVVVYFWLLLAVMIECVKFFYDPEYGNSFVLPSLDVTVKENLFGGFVFADLILFIPLFFRQVKANRRRALIIWFSADVIVFFVLQLIQKISPEIFYQMPAAVAKTILILEMVYSLLSFLVTMWIIKKNSN